MSLFTPVRLEGRFVSLEPLRRTHAEPLFAAAAESLESYGLTSVPSSLDAMREYVAFACAENENGRALAFATVDRAQGRVVGSTRFTHPEHYAWPGQVPLPRPDGPDAVEIGWTWLAASAQRTPINTEAKLLMFRHALETCQVRRVMLKTDVRNVRSRAAMERLGLRFEGVLRANQPASDGGVRDSAYYSVVRGEWPEFRARLERLLEPRQRPALRAVRAGVGDAGALVQGVVETQAIDPQRRALLESRLASGLGSGQLDVWLAREGAEVAAFCALERDGSSFAAEGEARLTLHVRERFLEQGLETELVQLALAHARESGLTRLRVDSASPQRSVFTRLGFQAQLTGMTFAL